MSNNLIQAAELLPCPFCGSRAEIVHTNNHIRCVNIYNCDSETRLGLTAWNRRASLAASKPEPSGELVPVEYLVEAEWPDRFAVPLEVTQVHILGGDKVGIRVKPHESRAALAAAKQVASAEQQGEHVAEVTAHGDTIRLNHHLPIGTKLYTHRDRVKSEPLTEEERDDAAVDRFAIAMKEKLASARSKGRGGWQECDPNDLKRMLRDHVEKGDPRDVANFCMFLWNLGHGIAQKEGE